MWTLINKNMSNTCEFIVPCSQMYFPSPFPCTLFILFREQLGVLSLWIFQASPLHLINWTNTLLSLSPSCCHFALTLSWKISTSFSRKRGLCPLHTTFFFFFSKSIHFSPLQGSLWMRVPECWGRIFCVCRAPSQPPQAGLFFWPWWQGASGTSLFSRLSI